MVFSSEILQSCFKMKGIHGKKRPFKTEKRYWRLDCGNIRHFPFITTGNNNQGKKYPKPAIHNYPVCAKMLINGLDQIKEPCKTYAKVTELCT
ncbi:hypothetical protein D3C86_1836330 [compost metagenome]